MNFTYSIIGPNAAITLQLQHFLEEFGEFCCVAESGDTQTGLNEFLKHDPDLLFLSLDKEPAASFSLVHELLQYKDELPVIIGLSSSKEKAYDAIKNNFFDYWLLPLNEFEIRKSVLRLRKKLPKESTKQRICLKSYKDFQYLDTEEILYLKADNNATDFFMKDGRVISAYKTLKSYEELLPANFVRVHQSYIINTDFVSRINYGKSLCSLKPGSMQLPFSKTYRRNIDRLKKQLSRNTLSNLN